MRFAPSGFPTTSYILRIEKNFCITNHNAHDFLHAVFFLPNKTIEQVSSFDLSLAVTIASLFVFFTPCYYIKTSAARRPPPRHPRQAPRTSTFHLVASWNILI
jgi:hypothetical protein